ncbi:hypothetical protein V493_04568 [Pseudogymnoascus sp. VKM F-4281 (FW-2241)]|nr:hypothetical protein V493_04568 [Pseudogymnoascus sp. VKM F-4281 (FW-2241)]
MGDGGWEKCGKGPDTRDKRKGGEKRVEDEDEDEEWMLLCYSMYGARIITPGYLKLHHHYAHCRRINTTMPCTFCFIFSAAAAEEVGERQPGEAGGVREVRGVREQGVGVLGTQRDDRDDDDATDEDEDDDDKK